jgi:hypothetical protein
MPDRVVVDVEGWLRDAGTRVAVERFMRRQGNRVRQHIREVAPEESGELKRKLRVRVGTDRHGPYAWISTGARNPRTGFRYGLNLEQRKRYLEEGLRRTPRQ